MKNYILNLNVVLRGYRDMPYACYFRGSSDATRISQKECDILKELYTPCPSDIFAGQETAENLERLGLIREYRDGDYIREYQKYRYCDSIYTPCVNWAITGRCNYRCLHCFNAGDSGEEADEFSKEQAFRLIDEFCECGIMNVALTGGEPMFHPDFMDIVWYMDKNGLNLKEITTNGAFITREWAQELVGMNPHLLFKLSFDGLGYHDWMRNREGAQKEALEKIELLVTNGCRVQVQSNLNRKNRDSMLETAERFEALGVENMRIIRTSESPRWNQEGAGMTLTVPEYFDYALYFAEEYAAFAKSMQANIWQVIELDPLLKKYRYSSIRNGGNREPGEISVCPANRRTLAITPSGEAVPCNQMSGWMKLHHISLGNVKDTPLKEILTDSEYRRAVDYPVKEVWKRNPHICGTCRYKKACLGGCRVCAVLKGGCESAPGLEGMDAYYSNYDAMKCLFFNEYMKKFQAMWKHSGWECENQVCF